MNKKEFKKAVYDLAKFNATLTKGYKTELSHKDVEGYKYKDETLKKLVEIAINKKYPVFYDGRSNVIYFYFGQIQISFHTTSHFALLKSYGLNHTPIEWDGIKNSYKYSEKQYIQLREQRKKELKTRLINLKVNEMELLGMSYWYLEKLRLEYKKSKRKKEKKDIEEEINYILKQDTYGLYKYFRFREGFISLCHELTIMYSDDYIHNFSL